MDSVIFINIIIFLIIILFIVKRYKRYKLLQLNDFILIFFALFFPLSLIRPYLGFISIIGYDIFKKYDLLETCSFVVLVYLLLFLLGYMLFRNKINFKKSTNNPIIFKNHYVKIFKKVSIIVFIINILVMANFIYSQGSFFEYLSNIESIRQTLTGQLGNHILIYLSVLLSLYLIFIENKISIVSITGILIGIISFAIYGFRGPVLTILIVLFFVLQKLNLIKIKFNFKYIFIIGVVLYSFVLIQDLRSHELENNEAFYLKFLTRFFGYEPLMVVYEKVIMQGKFTFNTFYNNLDYIVTMPIPRNLMEDKIKPVSIIFTDEMFYDEGDRSFATGGISPTIIGSLIWNFHYLGYFFMILFGMFTTYIENRFRTQQNVFKNLVLVIFTLYLILAVEYPENFVGVIWLLFISYSIIYIIHKIIITNIKWR